jgi:hypothetical protein
MKRDAEIRANIRDEYASIKRVFISRKQRGLVPWMPPKQKVERCVPRPWFTGAFGVLQKE